MEQIVLPLIIGISVVLILILFQLPNQLHNLHKEVTSLKEEIISLKKELLNKK
jgi:hypothetical protein